MFKIQNSLGGIWGYCCNLNFFVILTFVSWILIGIAVATIDSFYMNYPLHNTSATVGFIGLFLSTYKKF